MSGPAVDRDGRESLLTSWALMLVSALIAVLLATLAGGARGLLVGRSSLVLTVPIGVCLFLARRPRRSSLHGWLSRAFAAPGVALATLWVVEHPAVHVEACGICGRDPNEAMFFAVVRLAPLLAVTAAFAHVITGVLLRVVPAGPRRAALVRWAALAAVCASALAIGGSIAARARKPDPRVADWSAALSDVGTLRREDLPSHPFTGDRVVRIGDVHVRLDPSFGDSILAATVGPADPTLRAAGTPRGLAYPITIRHDPSRNWVVLSAADAGDFRGDSRSPFHAIARPDGTPVALRARDLVAVVPPPRSWVVAAAIAWLFALLGTVTAARARPPDVDTLRDGVHEGDGRVRIDAGVRTISDAVVLEPGPVVAVLRERHDAYRGADEIVTVVAGTRSELIARTWDARAALSARVLAFAVIGVTPLLVACARGLAP